MKLPWPDPKVLEQIIQRESPEKKPPKALFINRGTWKELMAGPTSHMWAKMVQFQQGGEGGRNYLMGIAVYVKESIPEKRIQLVWQGKKSKQVTYVWDEPTKDSLAAAVKELGERNKQYSEQEADGLTRMTEVDRNALMALDTWFEAIAAKATIMQRLTAAARIHTKMKRDEEKAVQGKEQQAEEIEVTEVPEEGPKEEKG